VRSVSWSPDGKRLASRSEDNTIKVWDLASGRSTFTHRGHTRYVSSVAWSPDGKHLASGSEDNTIKIWDAASEEALDPRNTNGVWCWRGVRTGSFWPRPARTPQSKSGIRTAGRNPHPARAHQRSVLRNVESGRKLLASASKDTTVKIWDVVSGHEDLTLPGRVHNAMAAVSWSPDGKSLAAGNGEDYTINLYDATSWKVIHNLMDTASRCFQWRGVRMGSSWPRVAGTIRSGSGTRRAGRISSNWTTAYGGCMMVAWSPDAKLLAVAKTDGIMIWDAVSWQLLPTLRGHSGGVVSVPWSPDGSVWPRAVSTTRSRFGTRRPGRRS
jgi:WD40 repeat protein